MRIALGQIRSTTDPTENLGFVDDYTRQAASDGARLVVFPEAAMCRFGPGLAEVAEPLDGPWATGIRRIAADTGVVVAAGMFVPAPDGRIFNTMVAAGPGVDAHYDKIHLYDAFGFAESKTVAPGREPLVVEVDGVGVGITTCYDVRFPTLYQELADRGAQVITVSASWGTGPGKLDQWTLLVRARAIDSTCFVAGVGQALVTDDDSPPGTPTGVGGSLVASPRGEVVAQAGDSPQLLVVDVDLDEVTRAREALAVLRNRSEFAQIDKAESRG